MSEHLTALENAPTGKAATQERILVAATALFMERGYEKTTVADVAERGGVSRATVFWHFSDKGGLFREAFHRLLAPFRASIDRDLSHLEARERLDAQLAMGARFARDHREEIAAFVRWAIESPTFREAVVTALLDLNQRFAGALTQTVAELREPGGDPQHLAMGLMLAFDANLLLSVFEGDDRRFDQRTEAIHGLAALIARRSDA